MITLNKFYFEPDIIANNTIKPIIFSKGLNVILGERSDDSEKMNSVGKSLLVEMINYCLLEEDSNRINKIPPTILTEDTHMCLELDIENNGNVTPLIIKRTRNSSSSMLIVVNGVETEFENLNEAKDFVESFLFLNQKNADRPSIRSMISILIREEKSSFDDILRPYATKRFLDFNSLVRPHLYLFGFDIDFINRMKNIQKSISETTATLRNVNRTFKEMGTDEKSVRSYLNDLRDKVDKLSLSNNELKPGEAIRQTKDELQKLESELERVATIKSSKLLMINKIKNLPHFEKINTKKVEIIYNTYREGLGDLVGKSLTQVIEFHNRIETFQNKIFDQRLSNLLDETHELDKRIDLLDFEISKIYRAIGADKKIDSLKQSLKEERDKSATLDSLSDRYVLLEKKKEEKKVFESELTETINEIDTQIQEKKSQILLFEDNLVELHNIIAGNKKCQFALSTVNQSEYIFFDYRIDLDGGSGMDRIRTFMYDILLMLSSVTSPRHLGFLIHDNIFPSTGRDDMVKSLNYVYKQSLTGKQFQYIVTLNKDEFEAQISNFDFSPSEVTKAKFTRNLPFLGTQYREG